MKNILNSLCFILLFSCQEQETIHLRKKIIKKIYPAIVEVVVPKQENPQIKYQRPLPYDQLDYKERNDKYHSIGTAFFIDNKNLISAAHVFAPESMSFYDNYYIRANDGKVYPIDKITRYSAHRDAIEFTLKEYPKEITSLALQGKVEIGDMVYAVGNAQGEGISTRGGQVSTFTPEPLKSDWNYIRFSSPTSPGNSGGPLVNSKGEAVGIVVMKNGSENLNYALPVTEIKSVSKKEAVIYERQLRIQDGMQVLSQDWLTSFPLPTTYRELKEYATKSKKDFYEKLIEKFSMKYNLTLFPNGPRFKDSLKYQRLFPRISIVRKDQALQNWHLKEVDLTKINASEDNIILRGSEDIFNLTLLLKNEPQKNTQQLFNSPRRMANRMSQAVGSHRTMANQQIPIVDYGEPASIEIWQDKLGRTWKTAFWHILHNNSVLAGHFTPTPEGVYAFFDQRLYSNISQGYMSFVKGNVLELNISYSGTPREWIDFLKLPQDLLPTQIRKIRMKGSPAPTGIYMALSGDSLNVKNFLFTTPDKARVSALLNYNPQNPLNQRIQGWEFLTHHIRDEGTSFFFAYKAPKLAPDWAAERWLQIKEKSNHYDGRLHRLNGRMVLKKRLKVEKNGQWWMSCFSLSTRSEKKFKKTCGSLRHRVSIRK